MKVYIAGPMTGLPLYNRPAFNRKACELISKGYTPIHTADMPLGLEYETYMEESFKRLKECEAVLLLEDWDLSPGAMREIYFAHQNGIRIARSIEELEKVSV